jgi:DNA-binding MarR family transcriptional regulator
MVLGALAARSCMDAPTASRVVEALVRRGLVAAEVDAADRRRTTLTLTAEGVATADEARGIAERVRASVVEGFTAAEEAQLRALLQRVIGNFAARG